MWIGKGSFYDLESPKYQLWMGLKSDNEVFQTQIPFQIFPSSFGLVCKYSSKQGWEEKFFFGYHAKVDKISMSLKSERERGEGLKKIVKQVENQIKTPSDISLLYQSGISLWIFIFACLLTVMDSLSCVNPFWVSLKTFITLFYFRWITWDLHLIYLEVRACWLQSFHLIPSIESKFLFFRLKIKRILANF